jgi:hypothetical protein
MPPGAATGAESPLTTRSRLRSAMNEGFGDRSQRSRPKEFSALETPYCCAWVGDQRSTNW